jgi:PAS domain-containing protein
VPLVEKEEKETWPDGSTTWALTTKRPLRDEHGAIVGTFGVSRDITSHKQAQGALSESEQRYRLLFNSTTDMILVHPFHEDPPPRHSWKSTTSPASCSGTRGRSCCA